jgi:hypothetical protein
MCHEYFLDRIFAAYKEFSLLPVFSDELLVFSCTLSISKNFTKLYR